MMPSSSISLSHVTKVFHSGFGAITALQDVTLSIAAGDFIALIGPSGCGKSTLLRLIGDLEQPTAGSILVNHKAPRQARRDRDYGIVFQTPVLYAWRTIRQNIELPLEITGCPGRQRHARADELMRRVGLIDFAGAYPRQLSGGMQQRVALARALSLNPSILLMDEPFSALDELTREKLQDELLTIWSAAERPITIVFVTHSISEAVFLADRVAVFSPRPGRIERVIPVDLPRPRDDATRRCPHFFTLVTAVRACLRET